MRGVYDISELVDCAMSLNCLAALDTTNGLVGIGKSHKKHSNIWMKIHKDPGAPEIVADQTDYRGIETNPDVVEALKEGFVLAQNAFATNCKWLHPHHVKIRNGGKPLGWSKQRRSKRRGVL